MPCVQPEEPRAARDDFERYYAERIWEWIPETYRHEDGLAENPGVLRALVEILARQAAVARRSIDRLWEDQYIDFADDWAVPYLGDLVGTRLVHELNRRGRRVDVAKTLFYRRRKGTPHLMEILVRDITGWEGVVVESFRRLARTRHRLDPVPARLVGPVTGTPPGGWADLARPRGGELVGGPFDEYFHTPDFRRLEGVQGRYNVPKLNFHLYRLAAFPVRLATPFVLGGRRFTFDPSGRDVPLFRASQRPAGDECRPVREWEIPAPIPCRLLAAATGSDEIHLLPEAVAVLVGAHSGEAPFPREEVLAANLEEWSAAAPGKSVAIDPERGRFLLLSDPGGGEHAFVPLHHYGFSGPVGAGTYDRRRFVAAGGEVGDLPAGPENADGDSLDPGPVAGFGLPAEGLHQLTDSQTYEPVAPPGNVVEDVDRLCLQAARPERPYVRLVPESDGHEWTFRALPKPPGFDPADEANRRWMTLEGLWVGIVPSDLAAQVLASSGDPCDPVATTLVLDGVFDRVEILHSTLDPGGERARLDPTECTPVPYVALEIRGQVEELVIGSSIVGPIRESAGVSDPCSVGRIVVRDSIVQSLDPAVDALATRTGEVHLERVTVLGDVTVNRLYATEALIQGLVRVTDNQHGCFRFSAAHGGEEARLPPRFEAPLFAGGIPNHTFVSRRFGDPGYAQLSDSASPTIVRGAENRSEMGAFSGLLGPIQRDDLEAKVLELMPFGQIPQFIHET